MHANRPPPLRLRALCVHCGPSFPPTWWCYPGDQPDSRQWPPLRRPNAPAACAARNRQMLTLAKRFTTRWRRRQRAHRLSPAIDVLNRAGLVKPHAAPYTQHCGGTSPGNFTHRPSSPAARIPRRRGGHTGCTSLQRRQAGRSVGSGRHLRGGRGRNASRVGLRRCWPTADCAPRICTRHTGPSVCSRRSRGRRHTTRTKSICDS